MRLRPDVGPADAPAVQALEPDEIDALVELVEIHTDNGPAVVDLDSPVVDLVADPAPADDVADDLGVGPDVTADLDEAEGLLRELDREVRAVVPPGTGARRDEELVRLARSGDDAATAELLTKYRSFAGGRARTYFLVGADRDDLVQEGLIGLYKAIRDFDPERSTSFRAFAEVCVTRQVISAVKSATRHKHGPLNNYVSFSRPLGADDDDSRDLCDLLPTRAVSDPADLVISAERIRALQAHVDEVLSDLESEVLRLYVEGKSYQEIAEHLQRHVKSIDNALQRIKKKLEGHLRARAEADAG